MPKLKANKDGVRLVDKGGIYLELEVKSGDTTIHAVMDPEQLSQFSNLINLYVARLDYAGRQIRNGGPAGEAHARHLRHNTPRDVLREEARKVSAK